jgi:hypothetical protein
MSVDAKTRVLQGSCHCGALNVVFETTLDPRETNPRACDCSFCTKHAAAYVSDSSGNLSIAAKTVAAMRIYRQGSNNAQFLTCSRCGVLVAVIFPFDASVFGAVNVRCLAAADEFGETIAASPQQLSADEKIGRWRQMWVPDVTLTLGRLDDTR